jgi:hypothetical protein
MNQVNTNRPSPPHLSDSPTPRDPCLSHRNERRTATIRALTTPTSTRHEPAPFHDTDHESDENTIRGHLGDYLLPYTCHTIPGTPEPPSPEITESPSTTYSTDIRKRYLEMLIRTRRRRCIRRIKRPMPKITMGPITSSPVASPLPDFSSTATTTLSVQKSDDSTDLYYHAYANHRPEMGESNAESALREERINEDIRHIKEARQRKQARRTTRIHRIRETQESNEPTTTDGKLTNNVQKLPFKPTTIFTPTKTKACKTNPSSLSMILMLRYL